jgi:hypothetical protein
MARLTEIEKAQLLAAARRPAPRPPKPVLRPAADFVEFVSFASGLKPVTKPVRFGGKHWKL